MRREGARVYMYLGFTCAYACKLYLYRCMFVSPRR